MRYIEAVLDDHDVTCFGNPEHERNTRHTEFDTYRWINGEIRIEVQTIKIV